MIILPTLPESTVEPRTAIENHVLDKLKDEYGKVFNITKYYKTANEEIYDDCKKMVQGGVPNWLIRTRRIDTDEISPMEVSDWHITRLEIISVCTVGIEKNIENVDRYVYVMHELSREILRRSENRIKLPRNTKRPFYFVGSRDIFRNDDLDIILSEYNVTYIKF